LRVGINLLRRSALIAEKNASRKILQRHVDEAYEKIKPFSEDETKDKLLGDEKKLLEIIKNSKDNSSGSIYEKFKKETGASIKKYSKLVSLLEHKKLIAAEYKKGIRGRSRTIRAI